SERGVGRAGSRNPGHKPCPSPASRPGRQARRRRIPVTPALRVAIDATPLLGPRTGIGVFTHQLLAHLPAQRVTPVAYATTWRGRGDLARQVPTGVEVSTRPQAARPLRKLWAKVDTPPIEWWTGEVDVVHGPNYVVP